MKFYYLDPALKDNLGHHASCCRVFLKELVNRNLESVRVLGSRNLCSELTNELKAENFFEANTYNDYYKNRDPIAGWLKDFEVARRFTIDDLKRLREFNSRDVFFFNSVYPAQFLSVLEWLEGIPLPSQPRTFVEFGTDPGLNVGTNVGEFEPRDPRIDPRALLYRFAAGFHSQQSHSRVTLFTYDPYISSIYQSLIQLPVTTLPWPTCSVTSNRSRAGKRPIRISILGHQRRDKGYPLVPDILCELIQHPNLQFTIHNAAPGDWEAIQSHVRMLSSQVSHVFVDERRVDYEEWKALLEHADLVVCPYDPARYATSHSGIVSECLANAIPIVVPARTVLSKMAAEYGGSACEFTDWNAQSISIAILTAVQNFDELARRADEAARRWSQSQGISMLADRLLAD